MAKFRIKPSLVAALQAAGYMPGGLLKLRIPHKENRITGETCYEITFGADDIVEVANEFGAMCVLNHKAPAIKVNGAWLVADPSTPLFEEVVDVAAVATKDSTTHGTKILTKKERAIIESYKAKTGVALPKTIDHATMLPYLNAAKNK